jgi:prepilin-type N-terminal cleavage/methylation domain-containing protein
MRRGVTLPELSLALVVCGLLLGIAVPRLDTLRDTLAVEQAAQQIVAAHRRARIMAITLSRVMVVSIGPDSLSIRPAGDTARWRALGPSASGVSLQAAGREITFSPVGITTGVSNATFRLSRGASSRAVVLSRLGRVRVTP